MHSVFKGLSKVNAPYLHCVAFVWAGFDGRSTKTTRKVMGKFCHARPCPMVWGQRRVEDHSYSNKGFIEHRIYPALGQHWADLSTVPHLFRNRAARLVFGILWSLASCNRKSGLEMCWPSKVLSMLRSRR